MVKHGLRLTLSNHESVYLDKKRIRDFIAGNNTPNIQESIKHETTFSAHKMTRFDGSHGKLGAQKGACFPMAKFLRLNIYD